MTKKINLVVVAHPDDEVLGFGGAGAKLVRQGEVVQPVFLCGGVDARDRRPEVRRLEEDMQEACRVLGFAKPILGDFPNIRMNTVDHIEIVQFIERSILECSPHRVFTHHPSDLNDDHTQISKACLVACRVFQRRGVTSPITSIHLMEILSSTDWSFGGFSSSFTPNMFVEIEEFLELKLKAISCYSGVVRPFPHSRSEEVIRSLAAVRGAASSLRYAEAFQTVFSTQIDYK